MDSCLLLGACQRTEHRPHVCVDAYVLADALPRTVARPLARTTTEQSNNCMALGSAGHGMRACCSSVRSLVGHCVCGARSTHLVDESGSWIVRGRRPIKISCFACRTPRHLTPLLRTYVLPACCLLTLFQ